MAMARIEADYQLSAGNPIALPLPGFAAGGIDFYLKNDSTHPTGSLKHRLAHSLFLYALCNGPMHESSTIFEAPSSSTAASEAFFTRLLGLPFVAVMPRSTSPKKIAQIAHYGGRCELAESASGVYGEVREISVLCGGHCMDQFTYAERATDWRGNNSIAESMFSQMLHERFPTPQWIVVGAGTGATNTTIGRMVDVDHVVSLAAMQALSNLLGRKVGLTIGTNFYAMLVLAQEMLARGETGSILSLLRDLGERYLPTYYDSDSTADKVDCCANVQEDILRMMHS